MNNNDIKLAEIAGEHVHEWKKASRSDGVKYFKFVWVCKCGELSSASAMPPACTPRSNDMHALIDLARKLSLPIQINVYFEQVFVSYLLVRDGEFSTPIKVVINSYPTPHEAYCTALRDAIIQAHETRRRKDDKRNS